MCYKFIKAMEFQQAKILNSGTCNHESTKNRTPGKNRSRKQRKSLVAIRIQPTRRRLAHAGKMAVDQGTESDGLAQCAFRALGRTGGRRFIGAGGREDQHPRPGFVAQAGRQSVLAVRRIVLFRPGQSGRRFAEISGNPLSGALPSPHGRIVASHARLCQSPALQQPAGRAGKHPPPLQHRQ